MAIFHFVAKVRGRTSPAAQHAAYALREVEGPAQAHVNYAMRDNGRSQEDLRDRDVQNLPPWANGSLSQFAAYSERYERANARLAITWEIALPRELTQDQQVHAVKDFLASQLGTRYVYGWGLHEITAFDGKPQPHAHVYISYRELDGIDRSPEQFFRRYNAEAPEKGGARKTWNVMSRAAITAQRQAWADIANWHLEQAGRPERIHPGTLQDQGIHRHPERHLNPAHSAKARYQGIETPQWQAMLQERAGREQEHAQRQRAAMEYWEHRKNRLALDAAMTREELIAIIERSSQGWKEAQKPTRTTTAAIAKRIQVLEAEIAPLEQRLQAISTEEAILDARAALGRPIPPEQEQRITELTTPTPEERAVAQATIEAARQRHRGQGLIPDDERHPGRQGVRIQLTEPSKDQGLTIGSSR